MNIQIIKEMIKKEFNVSLIEKIITTKQAMMLSM